MVEADKSGDTTDASVSRRVRLHRGEHTIMLAGRTDEGLAGAGTANDRRHQNHAGRPACLRLVDKLTGTNRRHRLRYWT